MEHESPATTGSTATRGPRRWPLGLLTLLVAVVIGGGVLAFGGDAGPSTPPKPDLVGDLGLGIQNGTPAPDFEVALIGGGSFRLADHLADDGRPVVLNLWASWCRPCRAEMPAIDAAATAHPEVLFVGVAVEDDPEAAQAFAAEVGVGYPLAIDDADRVGRRYPSPGLPATFLISSDGEIVRTLFGELDDETIAQVLAESFGS